MFATIFSPAFIVPPVCSMFAAVIFPDMSIVPPVCFRSADAVPPAFWTARSCPATSPATVVLAPLKVTSFAVIPLSMEMSPAPSTVKSPVMATASLMVTSFALPWIVRLPSAPASTVP